MLLRLLLLSAFCLPPTAYCQDWPQWRGPRADGTSTETAVPTQWSATDNIAWRIPLPGKGHGSPIVIGDKIFLNTALEKEYKRVLMCLSTKDGQTLWQKEVLAAPLEKKHYLNSYASSTPASDGKLVFVSFLSGKDVILAAYTLTGDEAWRKSVGRFTSMHGWACSPMLYGDTVILNCDHDGDGYIVCLKREAGDEKWRIERPNKTRSYVNPVIFEVAGQKQMVVSGSKCVTGYNPDTGEQLWYVDGPTQQFAASIVCTQDTFFITGGFPEFHSMAITPKGDVLWHHKRVPAMAAYVPSPIAYDKWFFLVTDEGKAVCFDAKSGELKWSKQLGKHHRPSAVLANGLIYWLSDDGECFVVKASDKYELVARNEVGESCNASPVISDGRVYIRTDKALWCIGIPGTAR